jgi:hypothetical protein
MNVTLPRGVYVEQPHVDSTLRVHSVELMHTIGCWLLLVVAGCC